MNGNYYRRQLLSTLKYDSEIEYLESRGTQYINTNISANQIIRAQIEFSLGENLSTNNAITGASIGTSKRTSASFQSSGRFICTEYSKTSIPNLTTLQTNIIYNLDITFNDLNTTEHYALFARCVENANRTIGNARVHSAKLLDSNNDVLFDAIPVRIGQIGFMYDKVSNKLFSNSGTGKFILGPDVNSTIVVTQ